MPKDKNRARSIRKRKRKKAESFRETQRYLEGREAEEEERHRKAAGPGGETWPRKMTDHPLSGKDHRYEYRR